MMMEHTTMPENSMKKKKGSIKTPATGGLSYKMRSNKPNGVQTESNINRKNNLNVLFNSNQSQELN